MKKSKLIILITIIVLLIAGIICYIMFNPKDNPNNTEPKIEARELTELELDGIYDYISNNSKMYFLASEYKKPEEINLYLQIIYGYDDELKTSVATERELFDLGLDEETINFIREEGFDKIKITAEDMDKYLQDNLAVSSKDIDLGWMEYYSEKHDSYYYSEPSDAFAMNINFISGKINEEGLYIIKYEDMFEYDWTLTLKKVGEKYKFVSNISDVSEKIEEISKIENLEAIELQNEDSFEYVMYYDNETLYYVEVYESDTEQLNSIYYYEDSKCFACKMEVEYLLAYEEYDTYGKYLYEVFNTNVIGENKQ